MERAYATLEIKALKEGSRRTFTGIATTPTPDRMHDIVVPTGLKFKLPLPLLWQHDSGDPIGWVTSAKVTPKGIEVDGEIASIAEDGPLKERLDKAWQYLSNRLVRGLSIGFNPIKYSHIKETGGLKFEESEWLELSAVTIAANDEAFVTTVAMIKSIDKRDLAALGQKDPPDRDRPGASGQQRAASGRLFHSRSQKGIIVKTLKELTEAREIKAARQKELADVFANPEHEASIEEMAEFDAIDNELDKLDMDVRMARFHERNASQAKAVDTERNSGRSGPTILVRKQDPDPLYKGEAFVRLAICRAVARMDGNGTRPSEVALQRWGKSHPKMIEWIKAGERNPRMVGTHTKADVPGGGSESGEWGAELVAMDGRFTGDFIEFLTSKTVYDKLPLVEVPPNVTIKGQDGTATGYWVGQSKAIPASAADFSTVNLTPLKVAALAVMSKELIRYSSPSAEMLVANALRDASSQRIDVTFLSTTAASSGVSPAGLLNGVSIGTASGSDADALRVDIQGLYANFLTAKNSSGLWLVMQPALAKSIGLMVNALGQTEFPGLTSMGGTLLGDPVVTGDNVGSGDFILLSPADIYRIGDSGVEVSSSDVATIEQSTLPTGATDTPVAMTEKMTSMFQEESVAIKVVRHINYAKRRTSTSVVNYIGNAAYGPISGS